MSLRVTIGLFVRESFPWSSLRTLSFGWHAAHGANCGDRDEYERKAEPLECALHRLVEPNPRRQDSRDEAHRLQRGSKRGAKLAHSRNLVLGGEPHTSDREEHDNKPLVRGDAHPRQPCTTVERDGSRGSDAGRLRNGPGGASCKRWVRHYLPREDIFRAGVRG